MIDDPIRNASQYGLNSRKLIHLTVFPLSETTSSCFMEAFREQTGSRTVNSHGRQVPVIDAY